MSEQPEADLAEQKKELDGEEGKETEWPEEIPLEADPADTADQERTVEGDEDDYR